MVGDNSFGNLGDSGCDSPRSITLWHLFMDKRNAGVLGWKILLRLFSIRRKGVYK